MLNSISPPYPYHLLGTSLHYMVIYIPLSLFFPSNFAITLSVLLIQFIASLLSLYLLYFLFKEFFHLTSRKSVLLVFILYFIIISPYLLHATSEVLFLFYQLLAWTLLIQRRFFSAALAVSITFALRFNGAFFVLGFFIIVISEWWKNKSMDSRTIIYGSIGAILMFFIGFISFIVSWFSTGDFWLPLTSQSEVYRIYQGDQANVILSVPFFWWFGYIEWALASNSLMEILLLISGIATLILGIISLVKLYHVSSRSAFNQENGINPVYAEQMMIIYLCAFLGINTIASVNNFARFICFTFPIFPIFPLILEKREISSLNQIIIVTMSIFLGLTINIFLWLSYFGTPPFNW